MENEKIKLNFEESLSKDIETKNDNYKTIEDEKAGFNERFLAYLIDTIPFVLIAYISLAILTKNGILQYSESLDIKWKLIWCIIFILYIAIFSSGGRVTLGKYIMGIRIKDISGNDLSFIKALFRAIGYFISSIIINLGYLIALLPPKRALHDYIAGSKVIKIKQRSSFDEGFILVLSWSLMAFFLANWIKQTIFSTTPYEQKQIMVAKRTLSKIAKLEEIHFQKYGFYTNDIRKLAELTGNIPAVRAELSKNLSPDSIEIATNGKNYIITAKAKNWRKTKIEISNLPAKE